jgi:putative ABC transport system permease protein
MSTTTWEIGKLRLSWDLVWSLAMSSLKVRVTRALVTGLTISTATAFMMYLLTMPMEVRPEVTGSWLAAVFSFGDQASPTETASWILMLLLSLLVSAAGVLNTMLMSVSQRYREIGTIKCLGALDQLVLYSVLVEAALLGLIGAVVGVIVGILISTLLALADYGGAFLNHVNFTVLPLKVLLVFFVGMMLTTLGAAVPAYLAAKMPPIEAMRGEK